MCRKGPDIQLHCWDSKSESQLELLTLPGPEAPLPWALVLPGPALLPSGWASPAQTEQCLIVPVQMAVNSLPEIAGLLLWALPPANLWS